MKLTNPDIIYWIASGYLEGIGPIRLKNALEIFGNIKTFFTAPTELLQQAGISAKQIHTIKNIPWKIIENDLAWYEKNDCHLLTWVDEDYPKLLQETADAPPVLYVQGDAQLLNQAQLAMVGSRNPTATGLETAEQFAYALSQSGLVVTSGLALGIDAASHRGALAASDKTIAVMGTGLKQIYPKTNFELAQQIKRKGAIVSEFPAGMPAKAKYFPLRNRLISGLSLGVLVVEAALKSGSLITARFAAEQGREVFAIPSSIHHPLGKGCHHLIRQGAKLVENVEDILVELNPLHGSISKKTRYFDTPSGNNIEDIDDKSQQLLMRIGYEPTALDTIVVRSGLTSSEVSSMLLSLELKGYIDTVPGGYTRNRN